MSQITPTFKITIIGLMILTGAFNTFAFKLQNNQYVYEGPYFKLFFHPYMQTLTVFLGNLLALFFFYIKRRRDPEGHKMKMLEAKSQGKQIKIQPLLLVIPAFCTLVATTLQFIALNFIPGSIYQMIRGGTIITTFLFSRVFFKVKIERSMVFGSLLALIGASIVGASHLTFANEQSQIKGHHIIGYVTLVVSLFFNGFFFVFEQKLLKKYHLDPLQVVGLEGLFGLLIYLVIVPILTFVPCPFDFDICVYTHESLPYLERPDQYFQEVWSSNILLTFGILGILNAGVFNTTGVTITKHINALARSISDTTRIILGWAVGIVITVTAGTIFPNYEWEVVETEALIIQLFGFMILVVGNLVYNKIIDVSGIISGPKKRQESLLTNTESEEGVGES